MWEAKIQLEMAYLTHSGWKVTFVATMHTHCTNRQGPLQWKELPLDLKEDNGNHPKAAVVFKHGTVSGLK